VTQQNAALVQQSAVAAESMKQHALTLAELVATFRLDGAGDEPAERGPVSKAPTLAEAA
jgi:hypothetical protein